MRKLAWLLAPGAAFFLVACDASNTAERVVATPERTVVIDPNSSHAASPQQKMELAPEAPQSEAERAEAVQRNESTKARIEELRERLGRPQRRRLRDTD